MSYYHKTQQGQEHPNSYYIQRKRVYERIIENRKYPTDKAIQKYGIQFDGEDRVIIPPDLRKPKIEAKVVLKPMKAQDSIKWLLENHKPNGEAPKIDIVKMYKQLPSIIKLVGGDEDDIIPTLEKPEVLLKALADKYPNKETLKQKWQVLRTHVDLVPMGLSRELIHRYNTIFSELKGKSGEAKTAQLAKDKVYRWDNILEAVEKKFGKDSLENFFFRMFDEIPIRSEYSHDIQIVHQLEDAPHEGNFVLDRGGLMVEFHLREWKTKGANYPDEIIYKFSPSLAEIFRKTEHPRDSLLPVRWAPWVKETLSKAGFPNFPYGKPDFPSKDLPSAFRRTIATFRNSSFNEDKPRGAELARLMLHSHDTSRLEYRHDDFL